ncbi:MAG: hypothetical protein FJW20_18860 [Acidimicrobiia bacterium]|nr:hypothetical protein [Acidimicrobiia bacterium]
MKLFTALLTLAMAQAQDPVARGAVIFRAQCSVPYCHGPDGEEGRAPKLIGHSHREQRVRGITAEGVMAKGMPGFGKTLMADELDAVVQFVMSLSGRTQAEQAKPATTNARGRALFFDAARFNGCGACHEADGWGIPVGPDLARAKPASLEQLRAVPVTRLVTVTRNAEASFPGIAVSSAPLIRVYDLSSPIPVLRSFQAGEVRLQAGARWDHAAATAAYTDTELAEIREFLIRLPR